MAWEMVDLVCKFDEYGSLRNYLERKKHTYSGLRINKLFAVVGTTQVFGEVEYLSYTEYRGSLALAHIPTGICLGRYQADRVPQEKIIDIANSLAMDKKYNFRTPQQFKLNDPEWIRAQAMFLLKNKFKIDRR